MNLLRNRCIGWLLKAGWFPAAAQFLLLAVFILLILGGLGVTTADPDLTQYLRDTNLANLIVWSYWWPVIIIAAVLFGRLWCAVCPMEFITYWAGRTGLGWRVPGILKSGWVVTVFYTLVWIVGIQTLAINRIPRQMSLYMLLLILLAIDVSLIFERRAFCSYVCPVGHLLGLYALMSPFEWRAEDGSVCRSCRTKDCVTKKNQYRLAGRSCTSGLYPASITDNRDCLLCTQCLKACPQENLRFSARRPLADLVAGVDLRAAQAGFILVLSGFVVYEILSEWPVSYEMMMWGPERLSQALGTTGTMGHLVSSTSLFVVVPALALLMVTTLARLACGRERVSFGETAKMFTLLLLPTIAGAHILKSILRMSSRIPYWPGVLADPKGIETAQGMVAGTLVLNTSATDALDPAVSFIAIALLLVSLAATVLVFRRTVLGRKLSPGVQVVLYLSTMSYWSIFAVTVLCWRFFP
ncbi:MAG: 4Fe-4S binding protein [Sedimentisphaerales bacterium]|nr:4Fe-4S binding protein [Sedimentisphaerales bacterium]